MCILVQSPVLRQPAMGQMQRTLHGWEGTGGSRRLGIMHTAMANRTRRHPGGKLREQGPTHCAP